MQMLNVLHRNRQTNKIHNHNEKMAGAHGGKVLEHHQQQRQASPRGRAAPPYLDGDTLLGRNKSFQVERMIAGGGFGQIYRATNLDTNDEVAVKVERGNANDSPRMVLELKVLEEMLGNPHFPAIFYAGSHKNHNFIVMQMLGMNLSDIRKSMPTRKLSIHSAVRIGIQIIEALECLHDQGFLHRDLKPTNCCVGREANRKHIYVVDFGMCRRFKNLDGSYREPRYYCGFRGTTRYCSYRMHDRREQGPVDDLWGLYYTLAELIEGYLPWREMESADEMAQAKKTMKHENIVPSMPTKFASFDRNLRRLKRQSTPDYQKFQNILASCVRFVDNNAEFEWDEI